DAGDAVVAAKDRGEPTGLVSICSAHAVVLDAAVHHAAAGGYVALVEATCNQVNQDGGYTGMRPADFRADVVALAGRAGLAPDRLVLGGDHLGPNPWRAEPAASAMAKAAVLVRDFA